MRFGNSKESSGAQQPMSPQVVPSGTLKRLKTHDIIPSRNNPRVLFDPEPLRELRDSIRQHGVLVPITVYQAKGQTKYQILDGERRYRCCADLMNEGLEVDIPANVVEPPNKLASLLYMFSIHNFREAWELMPTALSLEIVMRDTEEKDNKALSELTGLSDPQINRCKTLLAYPERFQEMSLDPNPVSRIPSNFWIEAYPVLGIYENEAALRDIIEQYGRDGITEKLVEKYRAGKIKSVIQFRMIMEAYEDEQRRAEVVQSLREYILDIQLEARKTFEGFVKEGRKVQGTLAACDEFLKQINRLKLEHIVEKDDVTRELEKVRDYINDLLQKLAGGDAPIEQAAEAEE